MKNLNDFLNRDFISEFIGTISPKDDARILDLGCGTCPFEDIYRPVFTHVVTSDLELRQKHVDVLSSVTSLPFADASFDAVLLAEVIEHVPDDGLALREIARVLKPGGRLILTWPAMYQLHELPHDYWRHTEFGMARRLADAGMTIRSLRRRGDFFSVLGNQLGDALLLATKLLTRIPLVGVVFRPLFWVVEWLLSLGYRILAGLQRNMAHLRPDEPGERLSGVRGRLALFTLGYCVLAEKTSGER